MPIYDLISESVMAIDEQVELLKQGVRTWNAWRSRQPDAAVDLSHGALRGMALKGADLSRADLRDADLRGADLSSASLVGARFEGKVAYHYACHLRLLGQSDEVPQLIEHVQGATYVPLARQDQCCGFGGSFAVRYPQISGAMVDDKMSCILRTGADLLVSTDTGCLVNIGGRLHRDQHPIDILHIAELLERR